MAQNVTFNFSAQASAFLGENVPREDKLKAAAGMVEVSPTECLHLVFYLCSDTDPEVRRLARETLRSFDNSFLKKVVSDLALHPRMVDALVKLYGERSDLVLLFLDHPALTPQAAAFLAEHATLPAPKGSASGEGEVEPVEDLPNEGAEEEFQSKYQLAQGMGVAEKIKMALTGDKEWRSILIKDSNKLVSGAVIKNPRISDGEVLTIAKSAVQNEEIMRVICANKEWAKNYQIRKALVENNKTPLPVALRFVATLSEKDLSALARSKNVSSVVAAQARRILMSKSSSK